MDKIKITNEQYNALNHLASLSKQDWFYIETFDDGMVKILDLENPNDDWDSPSLIDSMVGEAWEENKNQLSEKERNEIKNLINNRR